MTGWQCPGPEVLASTTLGVVDARELSHELARHHPPARIGSMRKEGTSERLSRIAMRRRK
jgi:hypothetical protein